MVFEENIQSWVSIDNKIKMLNEQTRGLREQRNNLEEKILEHIKDNQLQNATIKISDGKLNFGITKQALPLSCKFIKECLFNCLKDENLVNSIMEYIKENRNVKESEEIKRFYNQN